MGAPCRWRARWGGRPLEVSITHPNCASNVGLLGLMGRTGHAIILGTCLQARHVTSHFSGEAVLWR